MSEDANYRELNPCGEQNTCRAIVVYKAPSERIDWTLEDLKFLHAIGVSHE